MLTENHKRGDGIALTKGLLIAVSRLSGDGLALSVIACAMPPLPKGEAFAHDKLSQKLRQPQHPGALGGSFVHLAEVHGGAVVRLQLVVAGFGLCH